MFLQPTYFLCNPMISKMPLRNLKLVMDVSLRKKLASLLVKRCFLVVKRMWSTFFCPPRPRAFWLDAAIGANKAFLPINRPSMSNITWEKFRFGFISFPVIFFLRVSQAPYFLLPFIYVFSELADGIRSNNRLDMANTHEAVTHQRHFCYGGFKIRYCEELRSYELWTRNRENERIMRKESRRPKTSCLQ